MSEMATATPLLADASLLPASPSFRCTCAILVLNPRFRAEPARSTPFTAPPPSQPEEFVLPCRPPSRVLKASSGDTARDDHADICTNTIPFHTAPATRTSALRAQQQGSVPQTAKSLIQGI
jgi:hypothetical protein